MNFMILTPSGLNRECSQGAAGDIQRTRETIQDLQNQVDRLSLITQSLWELLRAKLALSDEELTRLIEEIDLLDLSPDVERKRRRGAVAEFIPARDDVEHRESRRPDNRRRVGGAADALRQDDIDLGAESHQFRPAHALFRQALFSKVVPAIKKMGLLSPRQRERFAALGILQFEDLDDPSVLPADGPVVAPGEAPLPVNGARVS